MSGPLCEDPRGGGAAQAHLKEAHAGAAARVSASAGALAAAAAAAPGAQPGAAAAATEPDAEADPFNLDAIMAPPAPRRARARSTALHADAAERAACMQLACCRTSAGHCVGSENLPRRSRTHARTHAWAPASCLHALRDTCTEQASGEPHYRAAARAQDLLRADRVRSAARAQSVRRRRAFLRQACCLMRARARRRPPEAPRPAGPAGAAALRVRESGALKRAALLDCLDTARGCYRHAWARTSVDLAIEVGSRGAGSPGAGAHHVTRRPALPLMR